MKVLLFGSLSIDLVFTVDHIVIPGETIAGSSMVKSAGGKGVNQAAALAKAGMEVYMARKTGQDGEFLVVLSVFSPGGIIVLQNEISNTDFIIREAKSQSLEICLNPSPYNETVQ
ncbi:MAG: PfkB family carbohydrate kinase [Treponema sp.]|jgi:ribokinase|nr:PfkB family carbohydrate kinase [Treponema sp.]